MTGGAGFVGANLVRHLVAQDWVTNVVVLDNLATGSERNLAGCPVELVELVEGTVLDPGDLDRALADADAVVHLAARPGVPRSIEDPLASHHTNATGTLMVLEAMRRNGVPHVVMASSSSVYGANTTLPKAEGLIPLPMSPYAVSKLAAARSGWRGWAISGRSSAMVDVNLVAWMISRARWPRSPMRLSPFLR